MRGRSIFISGGYMETLRHLFSGNFMPHGFCYLWNPRLVWLHVISDMLIGLSYLSIPVTLAYLARKRRDVPFHWMFGCFGSSSSPAARRTFWKYGTSGMRIIGSRERRRRSRRWRRSRRPFCWYGWFLPPWRCPVPPDLSRINGMLAQQKFDLGRSNAQLQAANHELEAFCYSVSHDLRAPLRGIDGFSQALLEDYSQSLDGTGKQHLERVRAAAQRMSALIDDLLELSRITRAEIQREQIDLSGMALFAVAQELSQLDPARKAEFAIAPNLEAEGDPRLLRAVLENLLGNSWKFTSRRPAARIKFGHTQANGEGAFFVRDNGAGFDPAHSQRLFGAFQRLHATTEFPGTGVGLASVQRIIHRHGGRLWAEGAVNEGATFFFTLPSTSTANQERKPPQQRRANEVLFIVDPF